VAGADDDRASGASRRAYPWDARRRADAIYSQSSAFL